MASFSSVVDTHPVMLKGNDVAEVIEAAMAHEARLVDPLQDWEYGEMQALPLGHQWVLNPTPC